MVGKKKKERKRTGSGKSDTGLFTFTGEDGNDYSLTMKEKLFCESYLQFRGNAVDAIIEAGYDCNFPNSTKPNRKLAAVMGYENLRKPHIYTYITTLLDEQGFNDDSAEKQLHFLMQQDADLSTKKGALELYFKLKGKFAPTKIEVSGIKTMTDDELLAASGITTQDVTNTETEISS
jgi:hypothetical protein